MIGYKILWYSEKHDWFFSPRYTTHEATSYLLERTKRIGDVYEWKDNHLDAVCDLLARKKHNAPSVKCSCGIYAVNEEELVRLYTDKLYFPHKYSPYGYGYLEYKNQNYSSQYFSGYVVELCAEGKTITGTKGWRAQGASITRVMMPPKNITHSFRRVAFRSEYQAVSKSLELPVGIMYALKGI